MNFSIEISGFCIAFLCSLIALSVSQLSTCDSHRIKWELWISCQQHKIQLPSIALYLATYFHLQQAPSDPNSPSCYFSSDNVYSVGEVEYSSSGLAANLNLSSANTRANDNYTAPIGTLRLEVKYHTNSMLQFKVTLLKNYSL